MTDINSVNSKPWYFKLHWQVLLALVAGVAFGWLAPSAAENIGFLLGSEQIHARPWPQPVPVDYRIALEVIRFDGKLGGEACLVARWSVFGEESKKLLAVKRSSIQEPTGGSGYEDLVAAESRALARLSQEIAQVIITQEKDPDR